MARNTCLAPGKARKHQEVFHGILKQPIPSPANTCLRPTTYTRLHLIRAVHLWVHPVFGHFRLASFTSPSPVRLHSGWRKYRVCTDLPRMKLCTPCSRTTTYCRSRTRSYKRTPRPITAVCLGVGVFLSSLLVCNRKRKKKPPQVSTACSIDNIVHRSTYCGNNTANDDKSASDGGGRSDQIERL